MSESECMTREWYVVIGLGQRDDRESYRVTRGACCVLVRLERFCITLALVEADGHCATPSLLCDPLAIVRPPRYCATPSLLCDPLAIVRPPH